MIETWYILEDDSFGDPNKVAPGDDGLLRHKDGRAVAYGPYGPRSSSVDAEALRGKKVMESEEVKDVTPAVPKRQYKTRQIRVD